MPDLQPGVQDVVRGAQNQLFGVVIFFKFQLVSVFFLFFLAQVTSQELCSKFIWKGDFRQHFPDLAPPGCGWDWAGRWCLDYSLGSWARSESGWSWAWKICVRIGGARVGSRAGASRLEGLQLGRGVGGAGAAALIMARRNWGQEELGLGGFYIPMYITVQLLLSLVKSSPCLPAPLV